MPPSKRYVILHAFLFFLIFIMPVPGQADHRQAMAMLQEKNEVYFSFEKPAKFMHELTRFISIDRIDVHRGGVVFAYANASGFARFLDFGLPYEVHHHPGDVDFNLRMKTWAQLKARDLTESWDFYPTYEAYVSLMYDFEEQFPDLVKIVKIGETVKGRDLLFAKISPQVDSRRPVPQFMYTSTMHGDETAGFILSLRLIHYLLTNYGKNEAITELMDNVEIWICPNENPDGTYRYDNSTVSGATRGNINGVDLNRNYPNPVNDPWHEEQPETTAMINFADTMHFIMSANMHGGIELVNFPFDSWRSTQKTHADHDWWELVMHEYVDTVHAHSPPGYMTGMGDGVTHGGDWYVVYGSRQDYFNYYKSCREFTLELSNQKILNPELLPAHWDYNYRSLLNYIRQSTYGIHGIIYNNSTGSPLLAEVSIPGHDAHNSEVWTALPHGNYNRPLLEGSYDMTYQADGFDPVTISNAQVYNHETKRVNIGLGDGVSDELVEVRITVEGEGGKAFPFQGTEYFNDGANVYLNAEAEEGWVFDKWLISDDVFYDQELVYGLHGDAEINAYFMYTETALIHLSPDSIDFGEVQVGETSEKTMTVSNAGKRPLTLEGLQHEPGVFSISGGDFPLTVDPGDSLDFLVSYSPESDGEDSDEVIFLSDADNDAEAVFYIQGTGVAPTHITDHQTGGLALEVYPNPIESGSRFFVRTNKETEEAELLVYDVHGTALKVVHRGHIPAGDHYFELRGVFYRLPAGIYLVVFKTPEGQVVQRIMKL